MVLAASFLTQRLCHQQGDQVDKKPVSRGLMRKKSEEALDRMFKQAREDGSLNRSLADLSEDIGNIFNSSNDYGLIKNKKPGSITSFGGSIESSDGSSESQKGVNKVRPRSRAGSATSLCLSWGTNTEGKLPSVSRFECALLFVDISGFSKLVCCAVNSISCFECP